MVEGLKNQTSYKWWFDSHNTSDCSLWLQSTLAELNEKTIRMLKLIDGDADSFAQRAEMYYNRRPELIDMVEDFYRTNRSLAERYDHQSKMGHGNRVLTKFVAPSEKGNVKIDDDRNYDTYSEEYAESEIEDPEDDDHKSRGGDKSMKEPKFLRRDCKRQVDEEIDDEARKLREEIKVLKDEIERKRYDVTRDLVDRIGLAVKTCVDIDSTDSTDYYDVVRDSGISRLIEETKRLNRENEALMEEIRKKNEEKKETIEQLKLVVDNNGVSEVVKIDDIEVSMVIDRLMRETACRVSEANRTREAELREKDEEKREVIRQLSVPIEMLKGENGILRKYIVKKSSRYELSKLKYAFFNTFFRDAGSRSRSRVVTTTRKTDRSLETI